MHDTHILISINLHNNSSKKLLSSFYSWRNRGSEILNKFFNVSGLKYQPRSICPQITDAWVSHTQDLGDIFGNTTAYGSQFTSASVMVQVLEVLLSPVQMN